MKTLFILSALFVSSSLFASNYPSDYCHVKAQFSKTGPVIFGHVGSGCSESKFIIGYQDSGVLGGENFVDVVLTANCEMYSDHNDKRKVSRVIRMGREYHNTGYMSYPLNYEDFCPSGYRATDIALAFARNNQWDSQYGKNYTFVSYQGDIHFNTNQEADLGGFNQPAWDFIINLMRD